MCKMYGIIEQLCLEKGIKPGKLCSDLGISRGILSDLKAGRTKKLSAENVAKISAYFGVSTDYLITGLCKNTVTAYSNGICAYQGSSMKEIESILAEREPGTFRIVYRGSGIVITVDTDSTPSDEQIDAVISVYDPVYAKNTPTLTEKDRRDIAKDLENLIAHLDSSGDLMFDGDPMSDEARESIRAAMKLGLEAAKLKNKERFTPKKYKEK